MAHMAKCLTTRLIRFALLMFFVLRFITVDELEEALTKHHMGDKETIKEIIAEVDTDRVSILRYCMTYTLIVFLLN